MVFRRGRALQPINSVKHILDSEGVVQQVNSRTVIAVGVPNVDTAVFKPGDIRTGGKINGFFIIVTAIGTSSAAIDGNFNWYLAKFHDGQTVVPTPGQTGISKLRNQIIHEEKGVVASGDGTPRDFKGVIAIPKGMRRMREGDSWEIVSLMTGTGDVNQCIKVIYKSYF